MGIKLVEPGISRRDLVLLYSEAGGGKTRAATSLTERWGEIAYIAIDEGSENLDSVLDKYKKRIHVYSPDWKNPIEDGAAIATRDYRKDFPGIKTIVLDTYSTWTWFVLQYITNKGMFSTKRVRIGEGTALETALPDVGEYGGVHAQIRLFLSLLFHNQKDMNIILVCHADPPEGGNKGGPSTVGKKMTAWLPARFKTVIRMDRIPVNETIKGRVVQTSKFVARCAPHGDWIARINEGSEKGNPLPQVELNVDPVNLWEEYDRLLLKPEEN